MKPDDTKSRKRTAAIDWRAIERRMDAVRAVIEHAWTPSAADAQRVLEERARALAREIEPAQAPEGQHIEVVEFLLAHERYAVESSYVREVYPLEGLTPLPCTPAFVLGIVNVRGEILSVIDIKKFFDLPERGLTDLNKLIVLRAGGMVFGVLVDVILGIRRLASREIQPSLPTLTGIRQDYLRGITPARTVILDAARLLADPRIVVREQVNGTYRENDA